MPLTSRNHWEWRLGWLLVLVGVAWYSVKFALVAIGLTLVFRVLSATWEDDA